jgi:hypothetical protein
MADTITGTNTVKVDSVTQELASLRTTIRMMLWVFGVLLVPTITSLVMLTNALGEIRADIREIRTEMRTELKAANARLDRVEKALEDFAKLQREDHDRLVRLEAEMKALRKP